MTHPLDEYRRRNGLSLRQLAEKADTTAASLSRIIRYEQTPSLGLAKRIMAATNNEVTPNHLIAAQPPAPAEAGAAE